MGLGAWIAWRRTEGRVGAALIPWGRWIQGGLAVRAGIPVALAGGWLLWLRGLIDALALISP